VRTLPDKPGLGVEGLKTNEMNLLASFGT